MDGTLPQGAAMFACLNERCIYALTILPGR